MLRWPRICQDPCEATRLGKGQVGFSFQLERPASVFYGGKPASSALLAVSPPASALGSKPGRGLHRKPSYGRFQLPPLGARLDGVAPAPELAKHIGISAANLIEPRQGPSAGPKINPSQPKA